MRYAFGGHDEKKPVRVHTGVQHKSSKPQQQRNRVMVKNILYKAVTI